ncbi:hypothetical protein BH10PSE6_BH10PSE6_05110 [soil metagenome]
MLALLLVLTAPFMPSGDQEERLEARCSQLIAYFDRYGASRSGHSDGRRNHTRLGAEIDCDDGLYGEGIGAMKNLLRAKKFVPPAGPDEIDIDE